jgi:hypothetical protein
MRITARMVRVYGTGDQYGDRIFAEPPESPIEVNDWPANGDLSRLYLGAVPAWLLDAFRTRHGLGMLFLQIFARTPEIEGMTPPQAVEYFRQLESASFPFDGARWCVTATVERSIDVSDDDFTDRPHYWLQPSAAARLESEIEGWAAPHLEQIAGAVAAAGATSVLTKLLHSAVYFTAPNGSTFADPKIKLAATAHVSGPMSSFPFDAVKRILSQMAATPPASLARLKSARHWLLEARNEIDPWKKFLWSFLALEILARKAGAALNDQLTNRLGVRDVALDVTAAVKELLLPHDRQSLTASFATMALTMSPATAARVGSGNSGA